jgi:hypothetical protein
LRTLRASGGIVLDRIINVEVQVQPVDGLEVDLSVEQPTEVFELVVVVSPRP